MRRIGKLMLPAIAGLAAVQVNIIVNTIFATSQEGAAAWLNYAFRFLQLPIGVFGVAIATVSTTRYADAAADGEMQAMSKHLEEGLRLVVFLTVPSMVGLILLARPIVSLVYEHGQFGSGDTQSTAAALRFYATGLVAYSAVKVLAPAFYAVNRARVAVAASISAVAINILINILLHKTYGYRVLAFGTAMAAVANFSVLYLSFHKKIAPVRHLRLLFHAFFVSCAAAAMGAAVWSTHHLMQDLLSTRSILARAALVAAPIAVGVVVYALCCAALRIDEVSHYWQRIRRKTR